MKNINTIWLKKSILSRAMEEFQEVPQSQNLATKFSRKITTPNHKPRIRFSDTQTLTSSVLCCVEVYAQPNGIILKMVSLPNHMFTGQP